MGFGEVVGNRSTYNSCVALASPLPTLSPRSAQSAPCPGWAVHWVCVLGNLSQLDCWVPDGRCARPSPQHRAFPALLGLHRALTATPWDSPGDVGAHGALA